MHMPNGWQLLIILAVILLLFGAARLPALAKSLGQSARVFRGEMKQLKAEDETSKDGGAETMSAGAAPDVKSERTAGGDEPPKPSNP